MTDTLIADLTSKAQRETAGSDTSSRFDYQKDWAFCRMMQKHISGEDYLVAFEYHDDVLFLAPSEAPTSAEFCQVKTSSASSPRKLSSLTARSKGKTSILAKMFSNFDGICASHDVRVILVSNNAFEFSGKDVRAKDLSTKIRDTLTQKLQAEIPDFDHKRLEKLHFMVTGVSLDAMQSFLLGEAMELFCQKFGEDHGLNVRTWIRLVKSEIDRKNNYSSDKINSADELIQNKCISNSSVEDTMNIMHSKSRHSLDVSAVSNYLASAGWKQADIMRLQKKIPQANDDYYNPLNKDVKEIAEIMRGFLWSGSGEINELNSYLSNAVAFVTKNPNVFDIYKQNGYLYALGVIIYYEEA